MSNRDMPANPVTVVDEDSDVELSSGEYAKGFRCSGLSKREYMAAEIMKGLLSNPSVIDTIADGPIGYVAEKAADAADMLLSELEK